MRYSVQLLAFLLVCFSFNTFAQKVKSLEITGMSIEQLPKVGVQNLKLAKSSLSKQESNWYVALVAYKIIIEPGKANKKDAGNYLDGLKVQWNGMSIHPALLKAKKSGHFLKYSKSVEYINVSTDYRYAAVLFSPDAVNRYFAKGAGFKKGFNLGCKISHDGKTWAKAAIIDGKYDKKFDKFKIFESEKPTTIEGMLKLKNETPWANEQAGQFFELKSAK